MSQWPLIGVTVVGLGILVICTRQDARAIQEDITERSIEVLKYENIPIPPDGLSVDGRDVTLTGVRGSELVSDATRDKIANLLGVRVVNVKVTGPPPAVANPAPAPAPPPLPVEAQKLEVDLTKFLDGKTIRFNTASDSIHREGRAVLDQVYRILATAPKVAVDITGHTDSDGDAGRNLELSKRRAAAVKRYLVSKGIKADRMETEGFGATKPLVPNDSPANKAKNRRIEFHAAARLPGAAPAQ